MNHCFQWLLGCCFSLRAVICPIYSRMSLCEVISTTKKGFCMYKITIVYLITDNYLKLPQLKFYVFDQHGYKGVGKLLHER